MYILRPIIDLVADPAVCQRAVLTEGLQSTGEASSRRQTSWVSNHSPILFSRSFSQSSSVIRAAFSRYSSILSKTVASIVTISISVFNWFETNIAEQRSFFQTPVVRCHQISSDGRNKIKPQRYSACGKAKKPKCRHKDYAEQREQKSLSSHGAESFLTRYCRTHVFRYSTRFYGDIKEACLFINDTVMRRVGRSESL